MKVPPGFVEGSTLNGFIRNYYFARDNHDTPSRRDQREWAQGLMLSFRSGYTDTPIGIGLDAHAFYGLRLDGGGGSGGAGVLPLDSAGRPADSFSAAGAALKLRGLDSLLKIGDQLLENPVIASGVSRMVPQSYRGVTLKNYHFRALELDAGFVEATRLRNQSGHSHLTSGYGNGTKGGIAADRESPHIAWLGASYSAPGGSQATLYSGPPGGYLEPALPRPQPAVAAFQSIDPDALAALLQDPRPGPQPARPDRQRPLQRRPDPGRRRPVAEPQPAKGRWRHPVRLHRAERPDLPLRKQPPCSTPTSTAPASARGRSSTRPAWPSSPPRTGNSAPPTAVARPT
ncbi:porin [Pseudomonas aeruginosa]|nr:porin [Pseudomonas aeruginosa]